jgi:hypothetical protein
MSLAKEPIFAKVCSPDNFRGSPENYYRARDSDGRDLDKESGERTHVGGVRPRHPFERGVLLATS